MATLERRTETKKKKVVKTVQKGVIVDMRRQFMTCATVLWVFFWCGMVTFVTFIKTTHATVKPQF